MRTLVNRNTFENNQIVPLLQTTQTVEQASSLYIIGGTNLISENVFKNHRMNDAELIKNYTSKIFNYMPKDFFTYA